MVIYVEQLEAEVQQIVRKRVIEKLTEIYNIMHSVPEQFEPTLDDWVDEAMCSKLDDLEELVGKGFIQFCRDADDQIIAGW